MSRNTTQLIVTLDAELDTDTEDLERLTRQLREELSELDVQADLMSGEPAPAKDVYKRQATVWPAKGESGSTRSRCNWPIRP